MENDKVYEVSNSTLLDASALAGSVDPHTMVILSERLTPGLRPIKRRNIREVIKQIIPLIPADLPEEQSEDDFVELKGHLETLGGAWFQAPECEAPLWIGLATTIEEWLGEPAAEWPEWKWQVLAIFTGKESDRNVVN